MKALRIVAFVVACLVTVVALFYAVENWRGKRAWEKYRAEREAVGDRFEWAALAPPPVPDNENVAASPLFAELFPKPPVHPRLDAIKLPECKDAAGNWREGRRENLAAWQACFTNDNLLAALARYEPVLNEVEAALCRPQCRFPVRYEDHFNALLPHLQHLRNLARVYRLRALAHLHAGQTEAALADVRTCLRLADAIKDEPVLISFLVRVAIFDLALQPVWEGLVTRRWQEKQLATLQRALEERDLFAHFALALRGERLFAHEAVMWLLRHPAERGQLFQAVAGSGERRPTHWSQLTPTGWWYQNLLAIDRFKTGPLASTVDWEARQVFPSRVVAVEQSLHAARTTPYNVLVKMLVPAVPQITKKAAQLQTAVAQAVAACGVERYRLADGELPATLDAPFPDYLPAVPRDVIDGQPLRYRQIEGGRFILYSVGWNGADDGGQASRKDNRLDPEQGDWVWPAAP